MEKLQSWKELEEEQEGPLDYFFKAGMDVGNGDGKGGGDWWWPVGAWDGMGWDGLGEYKKYCAANSSY